MQMNDSEPKDDDKLPASPHSTSGVFEVFFNSLFVSLLPWFCSKLFPNTSIKPFGQVPAFEDGNLKRYRIEVCNYWH